MSILKPRLTFLLVFIVVASVLSIWRSDDISPQIYAPENFRVGLRGGEIAVVFEDLGSGLREAHASLGVLGKDRRLVSRLFPGNLFFGSNTKNVEIQIPIIPRDFGISEEGEFRLQIEVWDWSWWRGNVARTEILISVDLTPPSIGLEKGLTYVRRGGSAIAVYTVAEETERTGVSIGTEFFPGYLLPTRDSESRAKQVTDRYVAMFTVPWEMQGDSEIVVLAEDRAGNVSVANFPTRVQERSFKDVRIILPRKFMEKKIPQLVKHLGRSPTADPVLGFISINEEERLANEERIREILEGNSGRRLWDGVFTQMTKSAVTSRYAENRTYFWDKKAISRAVHFGYDLASIANAPIHAANAGRVLFADDLGIYGNCVIIDHGLGLSTLYAHLSQISVKEHQEVDKGFEVGRSGKTGLAGGDHLHFAVLVNGHYVDPKEWWDPKWVDEHIGKWLRER